MLVCPEHSTPFKTVPAGVSKTTGRAYSAFRVCSTPGCRVKEADGIEIEKFDIPAKQLEEAPSPSETIMTKSEWAAKDDRIARLTLAKTALNAGFNWQQAKDNDIQKYFIWAKTGYDPDKASEKEMKEALDELLPSEDL